MNLRPITKTDMARRLRQDGSGRTLPHRECWEAVTDDGEWAFERLDEVGTPWIVVHHPRTPQAETLYAMFGNLKRAREAIERPGIERWLPSVQVAAHARGEHADVRSPYGCPAC